MNEELYPILVTDTGEIELPDHPTAIANLNFANPKLKLVAKKHTPSWYREVREKFGPVTEYHRLNFGPELK